MGIEKVSVGAEAPETCKNKKEDGRTSQEEESDSVVDVEESAALKKKKKKKAKEKEKKAGGGKTVDAPKVEVESRSKKVPKHVREIQERLERLREAKEKEEREEEEKLRKEEEERQRQEELERIAQEKKRLKKEREREKMSKKKQEGKLLTAKQKEKARRLEAMRNQILANANGLPQETTTTRPKYQTNKSKPHAQANYDKSSSVETAMDMENLEEDKEDCAKSWDDADLKLPCMSDQEEATEPVPVAKKEAIIPHVAKDNQPETIGDDECLRSPICCVMGHVNAGKTKLLDCIRRTDVQEGEAGGITQQIGATYIPADNIRERTKELKADAKLNVPGLLVIDTPGHEPFNNLRSRGSSLCDIAILVVDIIHGLEPQTIECLNLLRTRGIHFIVALNKVDRLYGWTSFDNAPIGKALKLQSRDVQLEFKQRLTQVITEFKVQGLNAELYSKNKDRGETYSIVPTSAISGEGIPEVLLLLVQWAQKTMVERLTYTREIQCTVLEVKVIQGLGTTIDVVLVNGVLHEGDEIVVCGFQGPIHTTIRSLLTPHPMTELRVKGAYIHHKEIKAAQGVKITAQNLEHAVAGTALYVIGPDDDVEQVVKDSGMSRIEKSSEGVYVQASTLGSLEALLDFLKTPAVSIPVSGIGIGPLCEMDVKKASAMLVKKKEFGTILAFDVRVTSDVQSLANSLGVKILIADTIFHLVYQCKAYIDHLKEEKKKETAGDAVFPCLFKIVPKSVFNTKDPIVIGVDVIAGIAKVGTPICIPQRRFIDIGRISSIHDNNGKTLDIAKKGQRVSIKITGSNPEEQQMMFGRHFKMEDELVSRISRHSIDALKANYRDQLSKEEWRLVARLKTIFQDKDNFY